MTNVIIVANATLTNNSNRPLFYCDHQETLHLNVTDIQTGETADSAAGREMAMISGDNFQIIQPGDVQTVQVCSYIVHPDYEGETFVTVILVALSTRSVNLIPTSLKSENPTAIPYASRALSKELPFSIKKRKSI